MLRKVLPIVFILCLSGYAMAGNRSKTYEVRCSAPDLDTAPNPPNVSPYGVYSRPDEAKSVPPVLAGSRSYVKTKTKTYTSGPVVEYVAPTITTDVAPQATVQSQPAPAATYSAPAQQVQSSQVQYFYVKPRRMRTRMYYSAPAGPAPSAAAAGVCPTCGRPY